MRRNNEERGHHKPLVQRDGQRLTIHEELARQNKSEISSCHPIGMNWFKHVLLKLLPTTDVAQ